MPEQAASRFTFRRAARADLLGISHLFIGANMLRRGLPGVFHEDDIQRWLDDQINFPVIVCLSEAPSTVVGYVLMYREQAAARAHLEDFCIHPDWEGYGLGRAMLGRGIWWAGNCWQVKRIEWISEDVPEHRRARTVVYPSIGAELLPGSTCSYCLILPYNPAMWSMEAHYLNLYGE